MAQCNGPAPTKGPALYTLTVSFQSVFSLVSLPQRRGTSIFRNFTLYSFRNFTEKLIPFLVGSYLAVDHVVTSGALCLSAQGSVDFLVH